MSRRLTRALLIVALPFVLFLSVAAPRAEAFSVLVDSQDWSIYLYKLEESATNIFYDGSISGPEGQALDIAGVYWKNKQQLNLIVRNFGTGGRLLSYVQERTSETRFKGFWWQHKRGDADYTRGGAETVDITFTMPGDFPDFDNDGGSGEGP